MLESLLQRLSEQPHLCAVSSERGLFNYGTNADVAANLRCLHDLTPPGTLVVGTLSRGDAPTWFTRDAHGMTLQLRHLGSFMELAGRAGWSRDQVYTEPTNINSRLAKIIV